MAQRSSRSKKKRTRYAPQKAGETRTGASRAAKAARSAERQAAATTTSTTGARVRVRPAGALGALTQVTLAWIGVALVAGLGLYLHRWNTLSYPDSLWLYVTFGVVAVAPAVGSVSRGRGDVDSWGAQALLVPLGMFVAESFIGPACPDGGSCASVGARGSLGMPLSILLIALLALVAWLVAGFAYRRSMARRPSSGRVNVFIASSGMLMLMLFVGGPTAIALTGGDVLLRSGPRVVQRAQADVLRYCFPITPDDPELAVRPNPDGVYSKWTSLLVRNADESRKGVGGKALPSDWVSLTSAHPYEASIIYDESGDPLSPIRCRKVAPAGGAVLPADTKPDAVPDTETSSIDPIKAGDGTQFFPKFYAQDIESITTARKAAAKSAADAAKAEAKTKPAAEPAKK